MKILMSLSVLLVAYCFLGQAHAACSQSQLNKRCYDERECFSADNPHHERCRTVCLAPAGSENYYCSMNIHGHKILLIQSDEETQNDFYLQEFEISATDFFYDGCRPVYTGCGRERNSCCKLP